MMFWSVSVLFFGSNFLRSQNNVIYVLQEVDQSISENLFKLGELGQRLENKELNKFLDKSKIFSEISKINDRLFQSHIYVKSILTGKPTK